MGQNTTDVSICNQALGWLGLDPIISLDDNTNTAALCKANLPSLRDMLLESSDWTFAQKRAQLAASTGVPVWGWTYEYLLPADCLRVCYATANPDSGETMQLSQWQKEGRTIVCNESVLYIRYIGRITDPKVWSEGFGQALAARLASDIAVAATNSQSYMQTMFQLFQTKYDEAVANDQRQGRTQTIKSNDLKQARAGNYQGGGVW